jgi:hypothetical protein
MMIALPPLLSGDNLSASDALASVWVVATLAVIEIDALVEEIVVFGGGGSVTGVGANVGVDGQLGRGEVQLSFFSPSTQAQVVAVTHVKQCCEERESAQS